MRLAERAHKRLAQFSGTNSKRPSHYVRGVHPTHLVKGIGMHVWDEQGRTYIDFVSGLGANLLGYRDPEVAMYVDKVLDQVGGPSLSLPTHLEVEVAELLYEMIPFAESIRFLKNGDDATMGAVRIARTYTNRPLVLSSGYHGRSDLWTSLAPPSLGVRDSFAVMPLEKRSEVDPLQVAAVIVEPVELDFTEKRRKDLLELREWCTTHGICLIADEIITGFRVPQFTISQRFGIEPDLICLGKAMANGFPLSVIAGRTELMSCGEWFLSSTFSGEVMSLAAAKVTLRIVRSTNLSAWFQWGIAFQDKMNERLKGIDLEIKGYGVRGMIPTTTLPGALFLQEMCKAGYLFGKAYFPSFVHWKSAGLEESVLSATSHAVDRIRGGVVKLEGAMPQESFKRS